MPPHTRKKIFTFVKAIKFLKPLLAPNGSIEGKLKSLDKYPNTAKKKKKKKKNFSSSIRR